ncbi:YjgB family protein [Alicyclobacillus dauci]|uniref:YjgB family protein n=1 Tax=Alicyclobacillus dauci TaxID=1475485 RepID=A0ABY6YYK5_9BACL|nr:YjgB family protein [Alicyclobacillus dauci]WAH35590.1 YjgB family protein [Alicyclobacillus dauci]
MKMKPTILWVTSSLMVACTILTGCAKNPPATPVAGSVSNMSNGTANSPTSEPTSSDQNTTTKEPSGGQSSGASNSAVPNGTPAKSQQPAARSLVSESMALAKQGKVIGIPFQLQSNIDVVQQLWGKASGQSMAGAGIYVTYGDHNAAFGMNKGGQMFDIRTFHSTVKSIRLGDITQVLGKPGEVRTSPDSVIYLYPAGPDYQLLFVFPKTSSGKAGATVDHVSVFWPQGTVNSMAATAPSPSVILDNAPGTVGQLFTFSIKNPPKGYRLVELEWLPSHGSAIVNTYPQAVDNGKTGLVPGFGVSGDGQTLSFVYTDAMKGQTGQVRVIFQTTSGAALLGQSESVTLK